MSFNQESSIPSFNDKHLNIDDHFISFGSNISSTESNVNVLKGKVSVTDVRLIKNMAI